MPSVSGSGPAAAADDDEEEEEEIYLAQTQQIKCKYKSYTIQLSRVTGKPEGQLCRPP